MPGVLQRHPLPNHGQGIQGSGMPSGNGPKPTGVREIFCISCGTTRQPRPLGTVGTPACPRRDAAAALTKPERECLSVCPGLPVSIGELHRASLAEKWLVAVKCDQGRGQEPMGGCGWQTVQLKAAWESSK